MTASLLPPPGRYRGRFAPSPTGPLHFGSLIAATGSFLAARHVGGEWLVRIEDLDPPREVAGAADDILRTLEYFGFYWDGPVMYQSQRHDAYLKAIATLERQHLSYACACTRSEIAALAPQGKLGPIYPGTCRTGLPRGREPRSIRMRTHATPIEFLDAVQGLQQQRIEEEVGDFVLRRADGYFAYQLAVVVDDDAQGITHVVRGHDLLDSTARQIYLQQHLGLPTPAYAHLPVAVNALGQKLSKQTHAPPIAKEDPVAILLKVLEFLHQAPPPDLRDAGLSELWQWAVPHWNVGGVPAQAAGIRVA